MVTVFRTGHEINERVCDALEQGFPGPQLATYGVLRGSGAWAKRMRLRELSVLMADKGYFKPGHFEGYYRLSWNGTQALFSTSEAKDDARLKELQKEWQINLEPWQKPGSRILICPPTLPVADFYGLSNHGVNWGNEVGHEIIRHHGARWQVTVRTKDSPFPLEEDLQDCAAVVTFNSGVGWEALRRGILCISDVKHSTVGSYLGTTIADLGHDLTECDRYPLFSFMANRQFTLAEISNGTARRYLL